MTNLFAAGKDLLRRVNRFATPPRKEDHLPVHVVPIPMGQLPMEDTHE